MTDYADAAADLKRVLLVEDSSVTKDLVELVLSQSGHHVTSVDTGEAALAALSREHFDVVLTDFHLPDISGLDVVRRFLAEEHDTPRPLFVAITGDTRGLLSDSQNCEVFDRVVPKPLDIDLVCDLVLEQPRSSTAQSRSQSRPGPTDTLGLALLEWPVTAGPRPVPGLPGIDAILIRERRELSALWQMRGANLLPVLDATGDLQGSADLDCSVLSIGRADQIRQIVAQFHERRAELHPDISSSEDPAVRLLARIAVAGGELTPRISDRHDGMVAWNTICDPAGISPLVSKLAVDGFLQARFFERVHNCPSCGSARLIVREECPACGSSHLSEESYLHHFRCATQARESEFVQGKDFVCPKCRRSLQHFGRDYDRPGIMTCCESCSETFAEPQVSFVCGRCETRTLAEGMPSHDIRAATLTDSGRTYLGSGSAFLGAGHRALRFGDFPLELVVALNKAAAAFNDAQRPFTLCAIQYDGLDVVRQRHGALRARDSRRLWLEALQQTMGDRVVVVGGGRQDYLLYAGTEPGVAAAELEKAKIEADRTVRDDLGVSMRNFGPEDFAK